MNVFSLTIDLVLVSNPMVWSMGNHMKLGLGWPHGVKLDFGVRPNVLGHGESFGMILGSLISIGRSKTGSRGSRRTRRPEHTQMFILS